MRRRYAFAGLGAAIGMMALVGPVAATAASGPGQAASGSEAAAANRCGKNVFLDGIRALELSENGHDEVRIENARGRHIWPASDDAVTIGRDQRVEVDKCVKPGVRLVLWEEDDDPIGGDDRLGTVRVRNATRNYEFRTDESRYRIGVLR